MKILILSLLFISSLGQRHARGNHRINTDAFLKALRLHSVFKLSEGEDAAESTETEDSSDGLKLVDMNDISNDEEYDIEDYYEDYPEEGSGGLFDSILGIGKSVLNAVPNMFGGSDEDAFDEYEGSTVVDEWWKKWSQNYDDDLYEDSEDSDLSEHVTRYPLPNLNENGHIDMSEFGFRDTLDEYFDIFVIILSASILLLLGCAAYGRIRNIRYLKKQYGEGKPALDEESGSLLAKSSD